MDDFESLKEVWQSQKQPTMPTPDTINAAIKSYQTRKKRNVIMLTLAALLLIPCLLLTFYFTPHVSSTTVMGEVSMSIGLLLTVILKFRTLKTTTSNEMLTNKAFLQKLKNSVDTRSKINDMQICAVALICIGYALYIYDSIKGNPFVVFGSYTAIAGFGVMMYTIFRPFAERKAHQNSEVLLRKISEIEKEF